MAAKTDVGLVRTNNEDNFQVSADLSSGNMCWVNNEICSLGDKGALLVVADGMGGMNAGEVASELAIQTVKECFHPDNLTDKVMKDRFSVEKFMASTIVAADNAIKQDAKVHPESRGMGTTIVIAWLLGGKLYVSWCGDSRAYIYNPVSGLHQITKDHSYVQALVDKGKLTREEAFDYPESNIITRSLSDGSAKAKPESLLKPYDLCNGDIILLCTDGLNGMIRDCEIEQVISANTHDMSACVDALISAACDAEGSDNVTICLCQVMVGGSVRHPDDFLQIDYALDGNRQVTDNDRPLPADVSSEGGHNVYKKMFYGLVSLLVLLAAAAVGLYVTRDGKAVDEQHATVKADSVTNSHTDSSAVVSQSDGQQQGDQVEENSQVDEITSAGTGSSKSALEGIKSGGTEKTDSRENHKPVGSNDVMTKDIIVESGMTLEGIAKKYGVTVEQLMQQNGLKGDDIKVGDTLRIAKELKPNRSK